MTRQEETKELISQWVMEGKELETIEEELRRSRFAGALAPDAIAMEYYAARTGKKLTSPRIVAKKTARALGALAILAGLAALGVPFFLDQLAGSARIPLYLLSGAALLAGLILLFTPERAFEK